MAESFEHGYALLVGVGTTNYPEWSLPVTVKDVKALKSLLVNPDLCAYPDNDQHIRLLHDTNATSQGILNGLTWLKDRATADPEATILVYYSGHGWVEETTGKYYLIQHDIEPWDIPSSALSAAAFTDALRQIPARRLLVFIDSCHAQGMAASKDVPVMERVPRGFAKSALPETLRAALKEGEGRAVFTSSRGSQRSWVRKDESLSIYTYHLLEALQGAGNRSGDNVVLLSNLMNHLGKWVPKSAREMYKAEQVPFFDNATEDFGVALVLGGKGLPGGGWQEIKGQVSENIWQLVKMQGDQSIAIRGSIKNSPTITGDRNRVQQGKYNVNIDKAEGLAIGDNAKVINNRGNVIHFSGNTSGSIINTGSNISNSRQTINTGSDSAPKTVGNFDRLLAQFRAQLKKVPGKYKDEKKELEESLEELLKEYHKDNRNQKRLENRAEEFEEAAGKLVALPHLEELAKNLTALIIK